MTAAVVSYLGNLEQGLGDVNDAAEVLDALDALLDGLGVVGAGAVEDAGNLLGLLIGVVLPGGAGVLADGPEDGEQGEGDDGLLVDDVQLVADGGDGQTGAGAAAAAAATAVVPAPTEVGSQGSVITPESTIVGLGGASRAASDGLLESGAGSIRGVDA